MTPPEPRLIAHLVTRNEVGRYLPECLAWVGNVADAVHVYDDHSTDDTATICREFEATVSVRAEAVPSFGEHEGQFREAAWHAMEQAMRPDENTWLIIPDADEFIMSRAGDERLSIAADIAEAETQGYCAVAMNVAEVFGWNGRRPLVRTDGFWGKISACRLVRWQPGGKFADRREGGGSVPTYVQAMGRSERLDVVHLGYARAADRQARYQRYSRGKGHNPRHIESILARPQLRPWDGHVPVLFNHIADQEA